MEQNPHLANVVRSRVFPSGGQHLCHSSPGGQPGQRAGAGTKLCRGGRNHLLQLFYRLGVLEQATDEAWSKAQAERV